MQGRSMGSPALLGLQAVECRKWQLISWWEAKTKTQTKQYLVPSDESWSKWPRPPTVQDWLTDQTAQANTTEYKLDVLNGYFAELFIMFCKPVKSFF